MEQGQKLDRQFYLADAVTLAPLLLGKQLCCLGQGQVLRAEITETEAYLGESDTACHAHKGRTPRTQTMYLPGGHAYIYLCYGMHNLLNIVTGPAESPQAVLIRGVRGCSGPGRLTKRLSIDRSLNGEDLTASRQLWLEEGSPLPYTATPRIGIAYATQEYREKLWRFVAAD